MKQFKWILNISLPEVRLPDSPVRVMKNGKVVGYCTISKRNNTIIGKFDMTEDLNESDYVLYSISSLNNISLVGIVLTEPYDNIEQRARKASDMEKFSN